ncbi:unnamed protein product [Protopolystoma xenopodis]|uniref:Uncharacterized protein n=1 Tax=Protopolystoma xenopodis TaxID=117903 RepID=A0A3S5ALM0_9PLAT|nr:unnamed protein product [Protopolystoma xenopodis]
MSTYSLFDQLGPSANWSTIVDVAVVVSGQESLIRFQDLLKSILVTRRLSLNRLGNASVQEQPTRPKTWHLRLHLLADEEAIIRLPVLLATWQVPQLSVHFYPLLEAEVSLTSDNQADSIRCQVFHIVALATRGSH